MTSISFPIRRIFLFSVVIIFSLIAGLAGGVLLDRQVLLGYIPPSKIAPQAAQNFQLISEAWNVIQRNYVDRPAVDPTVMTYGAISGMVDALGDTGHSRFLSPAELSQEHNQTQGQFEGIGAQVDMQNGHVVIVAPIDNSPAQKAGLLPGDIILQVNGEDTTNLTLQQVVGKILGPAGTEVTLTILSPNETQPHTVKITRARIQLKNVTWQQIPGTQVAHLRLAGFSTGVDKELISALQEIQSQNLTGVILDLRNNPGGLLDQAVAVTSQFVSTGDVLKERDASGKEKSVPVKAGGIATKMKLVVLINKGTASAAEITSGAIQDAKRAQLVGETTFGTGTVLIEFPLTDGSALLLAIQEWLTPSGRVIWHQGIKPDIEVPLPTGVEPLVPEAERDLSAEQFKTTKDAQLLKAVELAQQP